MLLVVGATAALSALAMALLTASLIGYEIVDLRHEGVQARLLAESALVLVEVELATGRLAAPGPGRTVTWEGVLPAPPPGMKPWPAGCGFGAKLTPVPGPSGVQRLLSGDFDGALIDVVAEGRCGRGLHARKGRVAVAADRRVRRLY